MGTMKIIAFDCDSTLSAIEGIDELGRNRGPAVFIQIEAMTHDAMNGRLPVEAVFGRRLELIQPSRADADAMFAYLQSQPAISKQNTEHRLAFPYNQRAGLALWRAMYLHQSLRC